MTESPSNERSLNEWSIRITQALQLLDFKVDPAQILELAEKSSRAVDKSGPISTFVVGYAAGLSARGGKKASNEAVRSASDVVLRLCEDGTTGGPPSTGWADTAQ